MNEKDLYWLSGLLEGEGSFMKGPPSKPNQPILRVEMTDEDVIAKVAGIIGRSYQKCSRPNPNWKDTYYIQVRGKLAVNIMNQIYPLMGSRRKSQIEQAISSYEWKRISKLTDQDREDIRSKMDSGQYTTRELGKQYGVSHVTIINTCKLP